jgi:hypothetical protein
VADSDERRRQSDELYERYGKPLEQDHWGEFVAISPDGRILLGGDLNDVAWRGPEVLGRGCFVFKVGERAVGKWR